MMISKKNEMKLKDKDVAKILAKKVYDVNVSKEDFALQIFLEALMLPKNSLDYDEKDMYKYILDFMKRFDKDKLKSKNKISPFPTKK